MQILLGLLTAIVPLAIALISRAGAIHKGEQLEKQMRILDDLVVHGADAEVVEILKQDMTGTYLKRLTPRYKAIRLRLITSAFYLVVAMGVTVTMRLFPESLASFRPGLTWLVVIYYALGVWSIALPFREMLVRQDRLRRDSRRLRDLSTALELAIKLSTRAKALLVGVNDQNEGSIESQSMLRSAQAILAKAEYIVDEIKLQVNHTD